MVFQVTTKQSYPALKENFNIGSKIVLIGAFTLVTKFLLYSVYKIYIK